MCGEFCPAWVAKSTRRLVFLGAQGISCLARGTDQWDTESTCLGGPHEPCRTDGTVGSTKILQNPTAPAGSSPPVRVEIKA